VDHLIFNFRWMSFNVFLAVLPVFAGLAMYKSKSGLARFLFFILWLLFIPNTIYLLTDPVNLLRDFKIFHGVYLIIDILLYVILLPIGVVTYILSIHYFEKLLTKLGQRSTTFPVIVLNLLIGLGIVLGRVPRLNSWEAITNMEHVAMHILMILRAPDFLIAVITCSVICQLIYLKFRKRVLKIFSYS